MARKTDPFSRREREIMDILYRMGSATAGEVHELMPDPPSYSAVRATLRILEDKGHVRHDQDGQRYLYRPTVDPSKARVKALQHLVSTFFDGSVENVVSALLRNPRQEVDEETLDRLSQLIDDARMEGR